MRYLHTALRDARYLLFYLVLWLTLAIPWYGATPIFGPAHFVFMAVNALIGAVPFFLDSWLAPRLRRDGRLPFIATFIYPLAGTALEFLLSSTNPIGNFGAFGLFPIWHTAANPGNGRYRHAGSHFPRLLVRGRRQLGLGQRF